MMCRRSLNIITFLASILLRQQCTHGFTSRQSTPIRHRYTRLHVIRRPIRPATIEKKIAERKAIVESRHNEALQDPTLLTNLSFADCNELHVHSKRAIVEDLGLQTMTEVQAKTFTAALSGSDVLARARTGTGKTLAFLIPAVERIVRNINFVGGQGIGCLVVAPTRELAIQIGEEAEKLLLHHSDLTVQVMYGGTKMARDMHAMNKRLPTVLVATPGRLLDHLQETKVRGRKFSDDVIANTDIVVLDEIDRLLDMGFRRDIQRILSYLPRKEKRQTMLFSATIPKGMKGIMRESLKEDYLEVDCVQDGRDSTPTNVRVTQSHIVLSDMKSVMMSIYTILKHATNSKPYKIVVFFPTARMVSFFADFLNDGLEFPVMELHSKKSQSSRNTASENFRQAKNAVLFTSDLSARGIDYPDVTQVIQIGLPESREQYIHRLGRTARAGKEGDGLLVLFPFEFQFLSELRGLDVPNNNELSSLLDQSSVTELPEWMEQNFSRVNSGGNKLASSAQLAYLAFLGYYLGQMSRIRIRSKEEVVRLSNDFSDSIGLAHVPALPQKLITKMDLVGVPGVRSEDDSQ
ncbi:RNA helicase [Thalassiosira pseudonana CCMP1335]|uniref:ATP-dependent RNA helicase n=1 Tax=Thalassiosira pseudonana TaxID=35128 RepID=B8BTF0_THAPS|nr:RNA helicase [Thalassiosira pseudonana CCMP1335]EED94590.1 RNA helicase [Thalassiosira pseudonana CCMP1335]